MKKLALVILAPFLLVLTATIGVIWWERGAPPGFRPTPVDVELTDLSLEHRGVRVKATAHYEARLKQTTEDNDEVWWLFPIFAPGDTIGRHITAVVRSTREPGDLYSFEDLTIEGFVRPPGRLVPREAREQMRRSGGYIFEEDYVLIEAWED